MDLQHHHPSRVVAVRSCYHDDATDLLAVAGEQSLDVLVVSNSDCQIVASFHIGARITAIAWSPRTVSPTVSDSWHIELAVADAEFGLHLLTKSSKEKEYNFLFGGGLTGHHGKVNDISFCGGRGEDSSRYVATVSDDKMLMVWDLQPPAQTPKPSPSFDDVDRQQPTAYAIPFPHPLTTISSHPSTSKEFLVSDCRGSIFLTDWRSDPQEIDQDSWRHSSLLELVDPSVMSDHMTDAAIQWSGSVAWRRDTSDIIGAVYGTNFSIWDIGNLRGGKPLASSVSFSESGHRFRWCPTFPEYFAISTQTPTHGAVIHVHNLNYLQTQPTEFCVLGKPHLVQDFDYLALRGIPRIAAAIGHKIYIFSIGEDA